MLRLILPLAVIAATAAAVADDNPPNKPSPADRWKRALLDAKKLGQLPGPRPGHVVCGRVAWACLWLTPERFNLKQWRKR